MPQSKFTIHTLETAPPATRPVLEQVKAKMGFIPNLFGIMAESPEALNAYLSLSGLLEKGVFSQVERDVLLLAVSADNRCHYCMAVHSTLADMHEVPGEIVGALRDGTPIADRRLEALRSFARSVVGNRGHLPESEVSAFLAADFTKRHILEVVAFVAMKTLSNYINHFAGTPVDEAFAKRAWKGEAS